jgi:hypothetical protein
MIDVMTENVRLLLEWCKSAPGRPHHSTALRWALRGVKGVKLETVVIGGRRYTSDQAFARFVQRLNAAQTEQGEVRGVAARAQQARVEQELDRAGL